jgi:hypothetical protein
MVDGDASDICHRDHVMAYGCERLPPTYLVGCDCAVGGACLISMHLHYLVCNLHVISLIDKVFGLFDSSSPTSLELPAKHHATELVWSVRTVLLKLESAAWAERTRNIKQAIIVPFTRAAYNGRSEAKAYWVGISVRFTVHQYQKRNYSARGNRCKRGSGCRLMTQQKPRPCPPSAF